MGFPTEILLAGHTVSVTLVTDAEMGDLGDYTDAYNALRVNTDKTPASVRRETLLHEVLHAVSDKYGLKMPEDMVCGLSTALDAVLIRNPDLVGLYSDCDSGDEKGG